MDQYNNHSPGCFRGWVGSINLSSYKLGMIPSFRNRWDCEGCMPTKFGDSVQHLMVEQQWACVDWDSRTESIQKRARRDGLGYMRLTMDNSRDYLIVSEPGLMEVTEPLPIIEAMSSAYRESLDNGLKRLSFNSLWKPPDKDARYHTFPTYKDDKVRVLEAVKEAGFELGKPIDCEIYEAEERIREALVERFGLFE